MDRWIDLERDDDASGIDALLDAAFGPGRETRTAYRFRDCTDPVRELGFVMRTHATDSGSTRLLGSVRFWPVLICPAKGDSLQALLLGPLAVLPELRGMGIGIALLKHGLAAVRDAGIGPVFLIGDLSYYSRVGFRQILPSLCTMPGPVEQDRILFWDADPDYKVPERFALKPLIAQLATFPPPHQGA